MATTCNSISPSTEGFPSKEDNLRQPVLLEYLLMTNLLANTLTALTSGRILIYRMHLVGRTRFGYYYDGKQTWGVYICGAPWEIAHKLCSHQSISNNYTHCLKISYVKSGLMSILMGQHKRQLQ